MGSGEGYIWAVMSQKDFLMHYFASLVAKFVK